MSRYKTLEALQNDRDNFIMIKDSVKWENCEVNIRGEDNVLIIQDGVTLDDVTINLVGNHNIVFLGNDLSLKATISCGNDSVVYLGEKVRFANKGIIHAGECGIIILSGDNYFGNNALIHTSDLFGLYDLNDGKRVNQAIPIYFGKHTFASNNVEFKRGTICGSGCAIGTNSVIDKWLACNTYYYGNPAMLQKEHVFWEPNNVGLDTLNSKFLLSRNCEQYVYDNSSDEKLFKLFNEKLVGNPNIDDKINFLTQLNELL